MAKKFTVPVQLPAIDPTDDNHAARKKYVDDQLGGAIGIVESPTPPANTDVLWIDPNEDIGYQTKTISSTGTLISFTIPTIYNIGTAGTGNITHNLTNAQLGTVQKIYHNGSVEPTFPAEWVLIGSGTYQVNVLNVIYAEYISVTRVEYWIVQEA